MFRDAGVRGKLFAVLAIPMCLLVVATGWLVGGQVQAARQAGQVEAVTDVAIQLNRVVHNLQTERSITLVFLRNPTAAQRGAMLAQRTKTNSALTVLTDKLAASPIADMSDSIQAASARTTSGHGELVGARKSIDAGRFFSTETDVFYGKIIAADLQLPGVISASASPDLAQRLQAEEDLSNTIESASHERDIVQIANLAGIINEAEFGQATALVAQQRQSLQDFQRSAPPELFAALDTKLADSDVTQMDTSRRHLTDLLKGREPNSAGSAGWLKASNQRIASMVDTETDLVSSIANVAAALQSSEQLKAGIFGAAAIFGLVLAILLATVFAQRISRPLRRLTEAAGEIGNELPRMVERMQSPGEGPGVVVDPIPVESDDEIGRLAAAFNTVNEVTLRVAKEQAALRASIAEMFVNVARRNQVLLGRQLAQLDKMEAREEDPDLLKNLFRLDHLATRMRRNAESLLVLAGIDSTRRLRHSMPLSDVIRTAVGEIEAYARVDSSIGDDPDVAGRHALSVAHLLAELLENAAVFSNPDTRVVVSSAMTGHGVDVTITDYGLGMSDEEIAQANESIANPPVAEIAVSQRLGLFVVGRIAARLGATASLRRGRATGTVVTVGLPLDLFEGMQVDEPVETISAPDAFAGETPLDELIHRDAPADVAALVGSVPHAQSAETAVPLAEVALFNPSQVELSRLPQVDVAALMAQAEADSRSHAVATPTAPESGGRRLLPRRSRFDDLVAPVDEVPVAEVVVDVVDESAVVADLESPTVDVDVAPVTEDAGSDDAGSDAAGSDDAGSDDAGLKDIDAALPENAARRRGSFFQRRSETPSVEPIEAAAEAVQVELLTSADEQVTDEQATDDQGVDVESRVDAGSLDGDDVAGDEIVSDAVAADEVVTDEVASDEVAANESVDIDAPIAEPAPRRSLLRRSARRGPVEPASDARAEQPAVEEPGDVEFFVEQPTADSEPAVEQPAFQPVDVLVEEAGSQAHVAVEPLEVAAPEAPTRRRGLFGRRQQIAEPVVDEAEVETVAEPDDVSYQPTPDTAAAEPSSWLAAAESVEVEPAAFEPDLFEPVAVEPVAVEPVAVEPVAHEPVETVAEQGHDGDEVVEEPDGLVETDVPTRRRGLFGRRQRSSIEPSAAEDPVAKASPDDALFAPIFEATGPELSAPPVIEPEPTPAPAFYFVPAIDILPGRPMGSRGKNKTPVPAYVAPPAPPAPVTTFAAELPAPPAAPSVPLPQFPSVATSTPARQASDEASAPASPVVADTVEFSVFDPIPVETSQPVASAPMSELDQLALNAELQKSALSELRGLYEPASHQSAAPVADASAGLIRRQPRAVEAVAAIETDAEAPVRTRDAAEVRGMLTGFRAGVERGRAAPQDATQADADSGRSAAIGTKYADDEPTEGSTD